MRLDNNQQAFFALVRAGLWEKDVWLSASGEVTWDVVCQIAQEQSVWGLLLAGLAHSDVKPPQETLLQWIGTVQRIERRNVAMNEYVGRLMERLRGEGVSAVLVKGQGIAQCYEKPLWRSCGDVDLLLSDSNYEKAKALLQPLATSVEEEDVTRKHQGLEIDGWVVELHGTLHARQLPRLNKVVDEAQKDVIFGGNVRPWQNGNTQVLLPSADTDVIIVFAHILQHFFGGGIGLRQICDWCRLLYRYRGTLNVKLLESRLHKAGVWREWESFAALAVNWLGMPADTIPLYSNKQKWKNKGDKILKLVLETGNFEHGRDLSYKQKYPKAIGYLISFGVYTRYCILLLSVSPTKATKGWFRIIKQGMKHVLQ